MKDKIITVILTVFVLGSLSITLTSCKENKSKVVKVGLLHSLTGTMSIS